MAADEKALEATTYLEYAWTTGKNKIVTVGDPSSGMRRAYFNVSRDEAVRRYLASSRVSKKEPDVIEFNFDDEFGGYGVFASTGSAFMPDDALEYAWTTGKNKIVTVGGPSGMRRVYLNVSRDEAVRRYLASPRVSKKEPDVIEFNFDDEFGSYGVFPTRNGVKLSAPDEKAPKADDGKPRLDLVAPDLLVELGRVLAFGARKYEAWSWTKGKDWSRDYAAAQRHLAAWWSGEDEDAESGLPHLAHAICDLMFLLVSEKHGLGRDDRHRFGAPDTSPVETPAARVQQFEFTEHTQVTSEVARGTSVCYVTDDGKFRTAVIKDIDDNGVATLTTGHNIVRGPRNVHGAHGTWHLHKDMTPSAIRVRAHEAHRDAVLAAVSPSGSTDDVPVDVLGEVLSLTWLANHAPLIKTVGQLRAGITFTGDGSWWKRVLPDDKNRVLKALLAFDAEIDAARKVKKPLS